MAEKVGENWYFPPSLWKKEPDLEISTDIYLTADINKYNYFIGTFYMKET